MLVCCLFVGMFLCLCGLKDDLTPLHHACAMGRTQTMMLLINNGAIVGSRDNVSVVFVVIAMHGYNITLRSSRCSTFGARLCAMALALWLIAVVTVVVGVVFLSLY